MSAIGTILMCLGVAFVLSLPFIGLTFSNQIEEKENKIQAKKIIEFRNNEQSCDQLKRMYMTSEKTRYDSFTDVKWFNEIRDKLIDSDCISSKELREKEFIAMCMDGGTVGCEISKLENPEMYENFTFFELDYDVERSDKGR